MFIVITILVACFFIKFITLYDCTDYIWQADDKIWQKNGNFPLN